MPIVLMFLTILAVGVGVGGFLWATTLTRRIAKLERNAERLRDDSISHLIGWED